MDTTATVVGIDISKSRLDVHVLGPGESFSVSRDADGLEDLVARLRPFHPQMVAFEATGGFEAIVLAALAEADLPVVVGSIARWNSPVSPAGSPRPRTPEASSR